jgi:hypothetical protein
MLPGGRAAKERFMNTDDDPGRRDLRFAAIGMGLVLFALVLATILS